MAGPNFRMDVSLGNVLQGVLLIVGGVVLFGEIDARTKTNADAIARVELALSREQAARTALADATEARVRALEQSHIRSDERLQNILTLLSRIDGRLERIEQEQRP